MTAGLETADQAALIRQHQVEQFLYEEARLADDSHYEAWLELYDDDATYWVPKGRANYDPSLRLSYINDNRSRLETRVRQLQTGVRWAQTPPSVLSRTVSNVTVADVLANAELVVLSTVVIRESATQGEDELRTWAGRVRHQLRPRGDTFKIAAKTVELVGSERSLPALTFLL